MLQAAKDAMFFAEQRSRKDLDDDRMFARAVLHAIQEIGEAAARVTTVGREEAPEVPWGSIVQMRHILVHAYFNVNLDYVWRVLEQDLSPLTEQLDAALRDWPES
jgi:uncharacterized protein with HEPN domain